MQKRDVSIDQMGGGTPVGCNVADPPGEIVCFDSAEHLDIADNSRTFP